MDGPIDRPMDSTTDLNGVEEELELLGALDPAEIADRASRLADALARALDALDEGTQP
jgi:hypothetical protein